MDFIERIFHIAPDGGTGTLELSFLMVVLIVPITAMIVARRRRARSSQEQLGRERDL
jgi:hypothetical protein